jgi:hypothetical protein
MTPSWPSKKAGVVFVVESRSLESLSLWTMTTGRDSSGDYFASFVISEFSERVTLKCSSKPLLTSLTLLLVEHWGEMS